MAASKKKSSTTSSAAISRTSVEELHRSLRALAEASPSANRPFVARLSEKKLPSLIVLAANEPLRVRRFISWLRETIFTASGSVTTYQGAEISGATVDRLIGDLQSQSLFASEQLVVIYDFDGVKAANLKRIAPAFVRKSPTTLVLLTVENSTKLPEEVCESGIFAEFDELRGATLERWITREIQRVGVEGGADADAIALLATSFGDNLTALSQEITKLALLVDRSEKISAALVQSLLTKTPERTTFELISAMGRRELHRAARLTADLLDQGQHPLQLSSFLGRCFRAILAQKEAGSAKGSFGSELSNPWLQRNLAGAVQSFSRNELRATIELLKQLDLQLKSSGLSGAQAMSVFTERVALRAFSREALSAGGIRT